MKQAGIRRHLWSLGFAGALALVVALGPESGSQAGAQPAPPPPPVPNATLTPIPNAPSPVSSDVPTPSAAPSAAPAASSTPASAGPASAESASPEPSETPGRRRRGRRDRTPASPGPSTTPAPEPTATPTSPAFATLDGTWEVQLQYIDHTDYSYLTLVQSTGGALSGTYRLSGKNAAHYPLTGNYDGRLIRITVAETAGPINFNGYVEGASDMIGLATFPSTPSSSPSPAAAAGAASPLPGALSPVAPTNANDGVAFTAEHRGAPNHNVLKR